MKHERVGPLIWLVIITVTVIVAGFYLYGKIEWVEYEEDLGLTEKARTNPYLAATSFLERHKVTLKTEKSFRRFDEPVRYGNGELGEAVVLVDAYGSLSDERLENLLGWVEQGGHLIAAAKNPFLDNIENVSDPLFDYFGVKIERQEGEGMEEQVWEMVERFGHLAGVSGEDLCPLLYAQTSFNFSGDSEEIDVHFLSTDLLMAEGWDPSSWVGNEYEAHMLQFDVGRGLVTLMSSLDLWKNSAIGCLDHSYVLWQLAPEEGVMTIFTNFEFPSVFNVVWRYFDVAIVIAFITLMLWLWHRGVRFGPIRERHDEERRQLLEHIDASASFIWRIGKTPELVASIREQVLNKIKQKHPQIFKEYPGLSEEVEEAPSELIEHLSKISGLRPEQIKTAFWQPPENDPQRITEVLILLQQIKDKI